VFWTTVDYIGATISKNGSYGSFAYSQVPAPLLIQSASLLGLWSITFALCLFANAAALLWRYGRRGVVMSGIIAAVLLCDLAFGVVRLAAPGGPPVAVGLVTDDAMPFAQTAAQASLASTRYAALARDAAGRGATTVVLPEKTAMLEPAWSDVLDTYRRAARSAGSRLIVGFQTGPSLPQNVALAFDPDGTIRRYAKRRLIAGFEPLLPGTAPGLLGGRDAMVICKDMDYPAMIRGDARRGPIAVMYVPAWDFVTDAQTHANMAVMRGVEDGFAVVRSARQGLMTVSNAQGRVVASRPSSPQRPEVLVARVSPGPGRSVYRAVGDLFAWCCAVVAIALLVVMLRR
jgi:apolipoprotein N-acyltransferase